MNHDRSPVTAAPAARRSAPLALAAAAALAAMLPPGTAAAGPLADPTRPPAALAAPGGLAAAALPHQANRDTARAIAAAQRAAEPPAPPPAPLLVQAVQLPRAGTLAGAEAGTAVALVDGRLVRAGEQLDGRTVLAIDAQGLLLKGTGPRGPERLWLLGGGPKLAAGSITQSQTARYQAAPHPGAGTADTPETQATGPAPAPAGTAPTPPVERGTAPGPAATTTSQTTSPTGNTSTAATALSLANALGKRTAP